MELKYKDARSQIEQEIAFKARMLDNYTVSKIKQKLIEDWASDKRYEWDGEAWVDENV